MTTPTVAGYSDLRRIGAGGFAEVFRATQDSVGRDVALKLLHAGVADAETERRFARECRVVGALSWHPHIAAVLDAGVDGQGRSYLTFELLDGGSLGDRLETTGPLAWNEAVRYAIQTADAVAAAHEQEVLHRDIKPDNVLLDRLGRAKLADFGIAQMHDGTKTATGVITATLAHAAPEVLTGEGATKLSDVYLLGSTLFELIAGHPPFGNAVGDDLFAAIHRIVSEPPPRLTSVVPGCPEDVAELIDRALRKDPAGRPQGAIAFGAALQVVQQRHSVAVTAMPFADSIASEAVAVGPAAIAAAPVESAPVPPPMEPIAPEAAASPPPPTPVPTPLSPSPVPDLGTEAELPAAAPHKRTLAPLLAGLGLLVAGSIGAAAFFLLASGEEAAAITVRETLQTASSQGLDAELATDGDLTTGWLSPIPPDGHEISIGFGQAVNLQAIELHAGPAPGSPGPLDEARGVGEAVLEFSDGTQRELSLDESAAAQTIVVDRRTSSLQIRTTASGSQPVAIREIEFVGTAVSG
ncbi:MAG: protein kinase [Actinomycetota bacterium]